MRAHGAKLWARGHSVIHREGRGHLQVSSGPEAWTGASGATDGFPVTSWSESRRRPLDRLRQGPRRAAGKLSAQLVPAREGPSVPHIPQYA